MTTYQHPVRTNELGEPLIYNSQEEYVEALCKAYIKTKKELWQWGEDERAVVSALTELAKEERPNVSRGSVVLDGTEHQVTVELKTNATYKKERGKDHPLRKLLQQFDELGELVRMEWKESGSSIQHLMDRLSAGTLEPSDNEELAKALAEVRQEKPAKSGIKVEDRIG